jgi:prepilin-type N-terminal cleavage/methylation domain-containing protein
MNRRAFTLVEMLVASALAAALMLAVMQIVGAIGRSRLAMARSTGVEPWRTDLLDTLRWDLANASSARFRAGRLLLSGHGALEGRSLTPRHEPAEVTYETAALGERSWLVRRQSPRSGYAHGERSTELLCPDMTTFEIQPLRSDGRPALAADDDPVPDRVMVRIGRRDAKLFEEEIVIR